jgi:hypothetical protein
MARYGFFAIQSQLPALYVKSSTYFVLDTQEDGLFKPDRCLVATAMVAPLFPTLRR